MQPYYLCTQNYTHNMYTHMYVLFINTCAYVRMYTSTVCSFIRTYVRTYVRMYTLTLCLYTRVCMYVHMYIHTCTPVYINISVACEVHASTMLHITYIHIIILCISTYIDTYVRTTTYVPTCTLLTFAYQ